MVDQPEEGRNRREWRAVYGLVIGALVLLIGLFYAFTKHFE